MAAGGTPSFGTLASAFLNPSSTPSYANISSAIGQGQMPAISDVLRYLLHAGGNQQLFGDLQLGGAPRRPLQPAQTAHNTPRDTIGGILGTL